MGCHRQPPRSPPCLPGVGRPSPQLVPFASPGAWSPPSGVWAIPSDRARLLSEPLFRASRRHSGSPRRSETVLPGLRRAARDRWRRAQPGGPWRSERDAADDALRRLGGHHRLGGPPPPPPSSPHHAGRRGTRLRRTTTPGIERRPAPTAITDGVPEPRPFGWMARSAESEATALIAEAHVARVLDHREAAILFAWGAIGNPVSRASGQSVQHPAWATRCQPNLAKRCAPGSPGMTTTSSLCPCSSTCSRRQLPSARRPHAGPSRRPQDPGGCLYDPAPAHTRPSSRPTWHQSLQAVRPPGCRGHRVGHHRRQPPHSLPRPHRLRRETPRTRHPSFRKSPLPWFMVSRARRTHTTREGRAGSRLDELSNLHQLSAAALAEVVRDAVAEALARMAGPATPQETALIGVPEAARRLNLGETTTKRCEDRPRRPVRGVPRSPPAGTSECHRGVRGSANE